MFEAIQDQYDEGIITFEQAKELNDAAYDKYMNYSANSSSDAKDLATIKMAKKVIFKEVPKVLLNAALMDIKKEIRENLSKKYRNMSKEEREDLENQETEKFAKKLVGKYEKLANQYNKDVAKNEKKLNKKSVDKADNMMNKEIKKIEDGFRKPSLTAKIVDKALNR